MGAGRERGDAFALPVIVSDRVGCHRDLVRNGVTGYVFPDGDDTALAARIENVMDRGRAPSMGEQARQHIGRYSMSASAEGIVKAVSSAS